MASLPPTPADATKDVLLPLVAAIWAAVAITIPAAQMTNERKDAVISGFLGDHHISATHREAILNNDWVGYVGCNIAVGILFAILLILITRKLERAFAVFGIACAILSAGYSGVWAYTAHRDYPVMEAAVVAAKAEIPPGFVIESAAPAHAQPNVGMAVPEK